MSVNPGDFNLEYKDVFLKTSDNLQIHGWYIPYPGSSTVLLFFHGNAGNVSNRLEKITLLREAKVNIFIIDYRGYGLSKGNPGEPGLYRDAAAAYNYLKNSGFRSGKIVIYGESLGTAVAVELAKNYEVAGLILEGSFGSLRQVAKKIYPFLPRWFFSDKFDSLSKIGKVSKPKLFIHAGDDKIIPLELAKELYRQASGKKRIIKIPGGHNQSFGASKDIYLGGIKEFIQQVVSKESDVNESFN
jgi:hypothetical protein